jgi:hypothetical protein
MAEIQFDTSQLTHTRFLIPGQTPSFLDGSTTPRPTVSLAPGTYNFQQSSGFFADFNFRVRDDGNVDYEADFDDFLSGRGSTTLTVQGFPVRLDFTALDHDLLPMIAGAGFLSHTSTHEIRLVPASSYGFHPGSGIVATLRFQVDTNGGVVLPPEFGSFATASGNSLTITGHTVRIDGRALDHDLLPISLGGYTRGFLPRATVNEIRIIPAAGYRFQPGSGIVSAFSFTLRDDGTVQVEPASGGFASASGNLLTISGWRVRIDGRGLSHDLLPISLAGYTGGFLPRTQINELTLIPAAGYSFQPGSGIVADMSYTVGIDGRVSFPLEFSGFLSGGGTDTLVVNGYPILVDARQADSDLLSLVNIPIPAEARRYLFAVLIPANGYLPQTANGVFSHSFGVGRDGTISFDPAVAGKYVVTPIPRLEIRGTTPF